MTIDIILVQNCTSGIDLVGRGMLEFGYRFICFYDPVKALSYLSISKKTPDVIIVDKQMNDMHCKDFLKVMQKSTKLRNVPVIVQIGDSQPGENIKILQEGAYFYLVKPFKIEDMLRLIKVSIRNYHKSMQEENEDNSFISRLKSRV